MDRKLSLGIMMLTTMPCSDRHLGTYRTCKAPMSFLQCHRKASLSDSSHCQLDCKLQRFRLSISGRMNGPPMPSNSLWIAASHWCGPVHRPSFFLLSATLEKGSGKAIQLMLGHEVPSLAIELPRKVGRWLRYRVELELELASAETRGIRICVPDKFKSAGKSCRRWDVTWKSGT
jgi:hypothetical protein